MDYRVQNVIALMERHLHRGWAATRFASCVNLSPSRLHQLFKEETGTPPARYLRQLRLRRARELLETTHLSVKEVMARVGVSDESHFVRDFKQAHGATPARYRQLFFGRQSDKLPAPRTLPPSSAPPLLLRRPSHPRHLAGDAPASFQSRRRRELLALLFQRHSGFARLTAELGASISGGMNGAPPISYRPRLSTVPRRPPPAAERPPGRGQRIR
jgi:AraC-like DNA-binding protein